MKQQLVREMVGGRIEVAGILERLAAGHAIEALITDSRGRLSREAIAEAATLGATATEPAH
jgi:uncharacterized protein (DUF433 family)